MGPPGVLAWPNDRARGPYETIRRQGRRGQPQLPGQTGGGHRLPRSQRGRQVHDHAHDARPRQSDQRDGPDRREALPGPAGAAEVHRSTAGREGHARRPQRVQQPALPRPVEPDPHEPGGRGAGPGRPDARGPAEIERIFARNGAAAGNRRRAPRRPGDPHVRRTRQRPGSRGNSLDQESDEGAGGRREDDLRFLPSHERNGADRGTFDRDRSRKAARRLVDGRFHPAELP